jgi:hypothetical protein
MVRSINELDKHTFGLQIYTEISVEYTKAKDEI